LTPLKIIMFTQTPSPFTHKRVKHSEQFILSVLNKNLNAFKNNVSNNLDVDICTNKGTLDVQYTNYEIPYVDFISVLSHKDPCVKFNGKRDDFKFYEQVRDMNSAIEIFQSMGYSIADIFHCLGVYAEKEIKPGKFMNDRYDYIAYVQYVPKTFDVKKYRFLDLNLLRNVEVEKNVTIKFNQKNRWNSMNDFYHSAYLRFPKEIIDAADVTQDFI